MHKHWRRRRRRVANVDGRVRRWQRWAASIGLRYEMRPMRCGALFCETMRVPRVCTLFMHAFLCIRSKSRTHTHTQLSKTGSGPGLDRNVVCHGGAERRRRGFFERLRRRRRRRGRRRQCSEDGVFVPYRKPAGQPGHTHIQKCCDKFCSCGEAITCYLLNRR